MRTMLRCALVLLAFFLSFGSAEGKLIPAAKPSRATGASVESSGRTPRFGPEDIALQPLAGPSPVRYAGRSVPVLSGGEPAGTVPKADDFLPPLPDIKADGRDDFVTVRRQEGVEITFSLDPGTMGGEVMDWWCLVFRGDAAGGTLVPMALTPIGRYALVNMPETHVCDLSLDPGIYVCMFVLDPTPDKSLEMAWYDYVVIRWEG